MLQQVSQPAPSAPYDRGLVTGEALGVAEGARPARLDFLTLLAQAETQEGAVVSGEGAPASTPTDEEAVAPSPDAMAGLAPAVSPTTDQHEAVQVGSEDGAARPDGTGWTGAVPGEAGLLAGGLPIRGNAAGPSPAIAAAQAPSALSQVPPSAAAAVAAAAQPATTSSVHLAQEEALPSDPSPAAWGLAVMDRGDGPAKRSPLPVQAAPGEQADDNRPAAARGTDLDADAVGRAIPQDLPAEPTHAHAFAPRPEALAGQPAGSAPALMMAPPPSEGRGLSMPVDPSMASAGSLPGQSGSSASPAPVPVSSAFAYQRLLHPQISAQLAPAVLSMGVVPGADGGPGRLTVAIRPAELGTLQIITERAEDGTARIAVLAERPETLQLLVRDAPMLETALRAAGVDDGGGLSLSFGLASHGQGDRGGDARGEAGRAAGRGNGADPEATLIGSALAMAQTSLLDLSL
jgi:hypothetical protein